MKKNTSRSVAMKAPAVERNPSVKDAAGVSQRLDYQAVVGLDVGDRQTHYCVLDRGGELTVEGVVATKEAALRVQFEGKARMRIALEAGAHSPWISRLLAAWGHQVIVANPRNLRMISQNDSKNDPADARLLARLAQVGPELLSPIQQRSEKTQVDLALVRARDVAVQSRTKIINSVRGMVKSTGHRLPKSSTLTFPRKAKESCPEALQAALLPLLRVIEELTREIELYEKLIIKKTGFNNCAGSISVSNKQGSSVKLRDKRDSVPILTGTRSYRTANSSTPEMPDRVSGMFWLVAVQSIA